MRVAVALVAICAGLTIAGGADARAGRGFKGGGRSYSAAPTAQPASAPRVGAGVGVIVPLGSRSSSARQADQAGYVLPLPPRPAEVETPRVYSASAETTEPKPAIAKRPWCHDGQVVGRGAGFCEVTLAAERSGAPAILALTN